MLGILAAQLRRVAEQVKEVEVKLLAWHRADETSRRLQSVPGLGPITASAIVATVGDPKQFKSGRQFAAWLGLVPQQRPRGQLKRAEQKRTNPCTTRWPTQRPVRHRHWPPPRFHGAIRPNATCSSRFSSAASATPIFIRSVTSGAMSCPRSIPASPATRSWAVSLGLALRSRGTKLGTS